MEFLVIFWKFPLLERKCAKGVRGTFKGDFGDILYIPLRLETSVPVGMVGENT